MKKLSLALCLVLAGSLILNSCKKKEDEEATPSAESLIPGTWKMTASKVDPPVNFFGTMISDIFNTFYPPCLQDNLTIIKSNNTYTRTEGLTKCNQTDPDLTESGTWTLSSDDKKVTVDSDSSEAKTFNIKTLSETSMVLTMSSYDSTTTTTYITTDTYAKQ